jgi:hypothetical protein
MTSPRVATGPVRHRRIRSVAAIAALVPLIVSGGYLATTSIGPDPASPTPTSASYVHTNARMLRELRESIAGQYGGGSAAGATVNPSRDTRRELRRSVAGQYGSAR